MLKALLLWESMYFHIFPPFFQRVSAVVVGADRIARNGDTANKIGTFQIAVLAKHHGVPFFIAGEHEMVKMLPKRSTAVTQFL